jgi:hypothetical protein
MILPQRNARLIAVARGGTSEDYDAAEGGDAAVWTGNADAYFGRRRATLTEGNALNRTQVSYVVVPGDLGVEFRTDDTLTLERDDETWTVEVREFNDRNIAGLPAQPIRLDLRE